MPVRQRRDDGATERRHGDQRDEMDAEQPRLEQLRHEMADRHGRHEEENGEADPGEQGTVEMAAAYDLDEQADADTQGDEDERKD